MSNIFTTIRSLLAYATTDDNILKTTVTYLNKELDNPETTTKRREDIMRVLEGLHKTQDQRKGTYNETKRSRVS